MKMEFLKKEMYVYIDPKCRNTKEMYGLIPNMLKFRGTIQRIKMINIDNIKIGGFCWSPEDLSLPKIEKYIAKKSTTPILFDLKDLVL